MNGGLIVSGCPRSGTSLCMDIQREAHGEDAILGFKFPQENRQKEKDDMFVRYDHEEDHQYEIRKYITEKQILEIEMRELAQGRPLDYKDMNPEGFWECAFTVQGIIYQPQFNRLLQGIRTGKNFKVIKVVSQGMLNSDPQYIGKIIYMIRHPRKVAKSQERLKRGFDFTDPADGKIKNAFQDITIHTPEMYIQVTMQAAHWFLLNPRKKVLFVNFDDLQENPAEQCRKMKEFVGFGDYEKATKLVQPKLNRSNPEDIEHRLWEDAEYVYEEFVKAANIINAGGSRTEAGKHFKKIIKYFHDPRREFNRDKLQWPCYRAKRGVNEMRCKACYYGNDDSGTNFATRNLFKKNSEAKVAQYGVTKHWSKEPCVFEMGYDLDRTEPYLTAEESVENNFWKTDNEHSK